MISYRPPTAEREGRIGIEASPAVGFDQYHLGVPPKVDPLLMRVVGGVSVC
jgi:hypothetical protein